jgi:hypothetical protein
MLERKMVNFSLIWIKDHALMMYKGVEVQIQAVLRPVGGA